MCTCYKGEADLYAPLCHDLDYLYKPPLLAALELVVP